jgi:protein-disulfide isomerase
MLINRRALVALGLALALPFAATAGADRARAAEPLPDKVLGSEDAPVTIIEYASMTCPHCASFHEGPFKELKEEYIDTGKVRFVFREFPFDPLAAAVSMIARCSGERYFDVVDLFFETQPQWAVREGALDEIRKLAMQAGFTQAEFEACLTDQELLDGINAVRDKGYEEYGVTATPTLIIDGEKLEGSRSIGALREAIDPKLGG